jgi:hypothetical protein
MDFNNLKKSVAGLSLYDIKAGVRQLQNGSFNLGCGEFEASTERIYSCNELYRNGSKG